MSAAKLAIRTLLALSLLAGVVLVGQAQQPTNAEVQQILDKYRAFRPDVKELGVYALDWMPTLQAAKEKAAKEQRPILLMVVNNTYGNLHTGHC